MEILKGWNIDFSIAYGWHHVLWDVCYFKSINILSNGLNFGNCHLTVIGI